MDETLETKVSQPRWARPARWTLTIVPAIVSGGYFFYCLWTDVFSPCFEDRAHTAASMTIIGIAVAIAIAACSAFYGAGLKKGKRLGRAIEKQTSQKMRREVGPIADKMARLREKLRKDTKNGE